MAAIAGRGEGGQQGGRLGRGHRPYRRPSCKDSMSIGRMQCGSEEGVPSGPCQQELPTRAEPGGAILAAAFQARSDRLAEALCYSNWLLAAPDQQPRVAAPATGSPCSHGAAGGEVEEVQQG